METKYLATKMINNKWSLLGIFETQDDAYKSSGEYGHIDEVKVYNFPSDIEAAYFIQGIEAVNDSSIQAELVNPGQVVIFENLFQVTLDHIEELKNAS
tara:strand:- start:525 stop:818 length:294 start_codon:yes stop_codon:yes gene_type:complete